MIFIIIAIATAYLIGSVPTAYIFGKALKNIDIRQYGSGNVGATNTFRTIGKIPGIIVLVIDMLKGLVSVTVLPLLLQKITGRPIDSYGVNVVILLGLAAICGHVWTVFLNFKGGKGVATTAGVMLGIAPVITAASFLVWFAVFIPWRYVSLASMATAVMLPVFAVAFGKDIYFVAFTCLICVVGVFKHKANIKRLLQGNEPKLL